MRTIRAEALAALAEVVRSIPPGKVASYGQVAMLCPMPATARTVGVWMAQIEDGAPWWRVVGSDGRLPIGKRDPRLESEQARRLLEEGVPVAEGRVPKSSFLQV